MAMISRAAQSSWFNLSFLRALDLAWFVGSKHCTIHFHQFVCIGTVQPILFAFLSAFSAAHGTTKNEVCRVSPLSEIALGIAHVPSLTN